MRPAVTTRVVDATVALVLVVVTALCFRDALTAGFIFLDDSLIVTKNPHVRAGFGLDGITWALTGVHAANWMPLTWMSHQLDWSLFGDDPRGHHAVSVLLHAVATGLLGHALFQLTGRRGPAAVVALLVGLHPLRVESVVWVAERKDVLSALFFAATLWAWARWRRDRRWRDRVLVACCAGAGLASKSMLITVPAVLMLIDIWRDGHRPGWRRVLEGLPEIAMVVATGLVMVSIQDGTSVHAAASLGTRLENAIVATWRYVELTCWPVGLSVFHPALRDGHPSGLVLTAASGLASITVLAIAAWTRGVRAPLMGWLWFLGMLVPVSGLVPIGAHAFAERYTNLPHIGLFIAVVFGLDQVLGRRWSMAQAVVGVVVSVVLFVRTGPVVETWHSSRTLAAAGLRSDPDNPVLLPVVASAFVTERAFGPAIERAEHAIAAQRVFLMTAGPEVAVARLGIAHFEAGHLDSAVNAFIEALTMKPTSAIAHRGLGVALFRRGEVGAGLLEARLAVRDGPDDVDNHRTLVSLLSGVAQWDEAAAVVMAAPAHVRRDLAADEVRVSFLAGGCRAAAAVAAGRLEADPLLLRAFFEERALAMACVDPVGADRAVDDIGAAPATRAGLLAALIVALQQGRADEADGLASRYRAAPPQHGLGDEVIAGFSAEEIIAALDRRAGG